MLKAKAYKDKAYNKNKQNKYLVYNPQHSLTKFKNTNECEELSLDSMYKRLDNFKKDLIGLKTLIHKQMKMKS